MVNEPVIHEIYEDEENDIFGCVLFCEDDYMCYEDCGERRCVDIDSIQWDADNQCWVPLKEKE